MANKLSAAAFAVIGAFCCTAFAEDVSFPEMPDSFTDKFHRNSYPNDAASTTKQSVGENEIVLVTGSESLTSGYMSPAYLATASDRTAITNNGQIWVKSGKQSDGSTLSKYVAGMMGSGDAVTLTNNGAIYVQAENGWNYESAKAMTITGGNTLSTATNKGLIVVKGASAFVPSESNIKFVNEGTIQIAEKGYGISLGNKNAKNNQYENSGRIIADGLLAVGITTSDGVDGTITNTGTITAQNGAKALNIGSGEFTINLEKGSQIDGLVRVVSTATSHWKVTDVNDSFELNASNLTDIALTNSTLGFEGDANAETVVSQLTMDGSSLLDIQGKRALSVETLTSNGTASFEFDTIAESGKSLSVTTNNAAKTEVSFSARAIDSYANYEEAVAAMSAAVDLGKTQSSTAAEGELIGNATNYQVRVDTNGSVTVEGSDITKSTNDLAALNLVSWRNETTNINDRMSTLRSNPSMIGAWARYNGGEYQYDARSIKNQFNTVEVGVDAQVDPQWVVGASFSYTSGDGDMDFGQTDTDTYAGALYALWTHEKGSFVDFVMKAGRMSSDFDFRNRLGGGFDKGTLDQTGFIVGVETGHRFMLPMNAFVEPQVQLTYSRLSSVSETTTQRQVDLEASDSLLGRVGFMAGINCPNNRGAAYVKASFVRDFRGDIDGTYSTRAGQSVYSLSQDLDDNWFEYAVGANFKLTDNFITFVDVSKSAGADIDLDWRANVGAKIFF